MSSSPTEVEYGYQNQRLTYFRDMQGLPPSVLSFFDTSSVIDRSRKISSI